MTLGKEKIVPKLFYWYRSLENMLVSTIKFLLSQILRKVSSIGNLMAGLKKLYIIDMCMYTVSILLHSTKCFITLKMHIRKITIDVHVQDIQVAMHCH